MRRRRRRRARREPVGAPTYTVYAVELREEAWTRCRRMREENPRGSMERSCLYVGYSAKTPAARLEVHRRGRRFSAKIVFRHGAGLRPDLYRDVPPVRTTRAEAEAAERALAGRLRRMGYRVWQR